MYRSRIVFTIVALAVASAAAATIRWQGWTPTTACLLCGPPESAAMRASANADNLFGAPGGAASYARNSSASTFTPGPLSAPQLSAGSAASGSSQGRSASSARGWQPWGNGGGSSRFASSGASGANAPLGGLWRLMSLSRPAHHDGTPHVARTITPRAPRAKPPVTSRPGRTPSPGSHPGGPATGNGSGITTDTPPMAGGAPSTDPFHEHEAPPPDPFRGPGGFDPGTPGGGRPSGGSGGGGRGGGPPQARAGLLFWAGLLGGPGGLRERRPPSCSTPSPS